MHTLLWMKYLLIMEWRMVRGGIALLNWSRTSPTVFSYNQNPNLSFKRITSKNLLAISKFSQTSSSLFPISSIIHNELKKLQTLAGQYHTFSTEFNNKHAICQITTGQYQNYNIQINNKHAICQIAIFLNCSNQNTRKDFCDGWVMSLFFLF